MMDNQPRARSHLSIKSRHKNGIGRSDGASVTLNVHPALAANPTGILKTRFASFLFLASYWNSTPTCSNFVTVAPPYSIFLCSAFPRACNRSSKAMMSCIRDGWKATDCGFIFPHGALSVSVQPLAGSIFIKPHTV